MTDAVVSELAATVQQSAVGALVSGDRRDISFPQSEADTHLRDAMASVLRGTQELFPGETSIEAIDDPEISGLRYLTVSCRSNRNIEAMMDAFNLWHAGLPVWAPGLEHLFRLSIDAIE